MDETAVNGMNAQEPVKTLDGEIQVEGLGVGDMIELENKGEFICFRKLRDGGKEYLFLMSKRKPKELLIARETVDKGILAVKVVKDPQEKERLLRLYKKNPLTALLQIFQRPKSKKAK